MTDDNENVGDTLSGIHRFTLDWSASTAVITMRDGYREEMPLPTSSPPTSSPIQRLEYFPRVNQIHLETDRGELLVAEAPTYRQPAPRAGRPVVYLDQKDWSLLANALYDSGRIQSNVERDAANRLIELVRARQVILPMSFGHLAETAQWTDAERRYRLALTLLELSRGWQMRHPVDVRQHELMQSMSARFQLEPVPLVHIFTLEPCAAQADSLFRSSSTSLNGLPPELALMVDACTCIASYSGAVLDTEDVQMGQIQEWVSGFQRQTDSLAMVKGSREQRRAIVQASFLLDLGFEIGRATRAVGITDEELSAWLDTFAGHDIPNMPSTGLFREVFTHKHLDRSVTWHKNDLVDMMHLCCAAGYANYVVGERSLVSRITQAATPLHRSLNIYRNLSELMNDLESDLG